ncbi:MAG: Lrp/AsnC ligand binding domain-containing protein [Candidatus Thermoplasmatota archaeon]
MSIKRGKGKELQTAIKALKGVESAELVSGRYDIVARLECNTLSELTKLILDKIHELEGIERTETLIVFG